METIDYFALSSFMVFVTAVNMLEYNCTKCCCRDKMNLGILLMAGFSLLATLVCIAIMFAQNF